MMFHLLSCLWQLGSVASASDVPATFAFAPWSPSARQVEIRETLEAMPFGQAKQSHQSSWTEGVLEVTRQDGVIELALRDVHLGPSLSTPDERRLIESLMRAQPPIRLDLHGRWIERDAWASAWDDLPARVTKDLERSHPELDRGSSDAFLSAHTKMARDTSSFRAQQSQRLRGMPTHPNTCRAQPPSTFPLEALEQSRQRIATFARLPATVWAPGALCVGEAFPCHGGEDAPLCIRVTESIHGSISGFRGSDVLDHARYAVESGGIRRDDLRYYTQGTVAMTATWHTLVQADNLYVWEQEVIHDSRTLLSVSGRGPFEAYRELHTTTISIRP